MSDINTMALRLERDVDRTGHGAAFAGSPCWLWTGPRSSGTGYGSPIKGCGPHRWAYVLAHGPVPPGMVIDHLCHNAAATAGACEGGACTHRLCCNPAHLAAVTHGQNLASSPLTCNGRGRKLCRFEPCDRPSDRYSGFCGTHHRRWLAFGDPARVSERLTRPEFCSATGCKEKHHARGYCAVHANRVKKYGDPFVVKQLQTSNRPDVCVVEGCGRPHRSRGWCGSHWYRWRKHGDPLAHIPIGESMQGVAS